jgi:hypothetical protein
MMQDMAVMMGAQMGASLANQQVTKEYQEATEAISTDQTNLNNASDSFFSNIQNIKSSQMSNITNIFNSAQNQVTVLQTNQQKELTNTENYIQAISSLNFPLTDYLDRANTILFDQLFANSKMYTPVGVTWRNVFQVGDWNFDETTNSFWQLKDKPFLTIKKGSQIKSADNAYKNSIFTEWNTSSPYEIFCDITLYKVSYPFYVGIIFNKARWISGDSYGIQKYRTLGIYGDINKKVSLCFAQQKIQKSKTATSAALPIGPLTQIYQTPSIQNFRINQKAFDVIPSKGITFHIKIKPGPTSISYKIWGKGSAEPTTYTTISTAIEHTKKFVSVTNNGIQNKYLAQNDNDIYLYHGIGFLSPGAIAEFQLKGPESLLFSKANLNLFKKEIENYYLDEKSKLLVKSL